MSNIQATDSRLSALLVQCARDLFAAYGAPLDVGDVGMHEHEIAGVIGFTGKIRGTLFVASTLPFFAATCPPPPKDVVDWTAELANQLLGRFKNQLVRRGIEVAMATPVAVRGLQLSCTTGEPAAFTVLRGVIGDVVVGLEAIQDEALVWNEPDLDRPAAADEGSLELF